MANLQTVIEKRLAGSCTSENYTQKPIMFIIYVRSY